MDGETEEPFRLNFQAGLLHSGSISFGRFESESLSWERRSSFSHNRHLDQVEKYSKPGSVTEKKAYFEAHFRRKSLSKQSSSINQAGTDFQTVETDDPHDLQESENGNEINHITCFDEGPQSYRYINYDEETRIQDYAQENCETFVNDHEINNVTCAESNRVTRNDMAVTVAAASEFPFLTTHAADKDVDSANCRTQQMLSSKVRPAPVMKQPNPKLKAHSNIQQAKTTETKEKKSPRPASLLAHLIRRKTLKSEESSMRIRKAKILPTKSIAREYTIFLRTTETKSSNKDNRFEQYKKVA